MKAISTKVLGYIPQYIRDTALVRFFGFTKVPLIFFLRPVVSHMDDEKCVVKLPLTRRSKNHLNSMYFGALATGADCAGGLAAMKEIQNSGKKVSLSFKEFHAEFLKRAEGDTYFTCHDVAEIKKFVENIIESGERGNMPVRVTATCPDKLGAEPVAEFTLTLSLKLK
jgi:acyl-coenzyme A thioesterase PaaI-like protein